MKKPLPKLTDSQLTRIIKARFNKWYFGKENNRRQIRLILRRAMNGINFGVEHPLYHLGWNDGYKAYRLLSERQQKYYNDSNRFPE